MLITYFGPQDPFEGPFLNTFNGEAQLDVLSLTPTGFVLRNPSNGIVTTFTGTGLPTSEAQFNETNATGLVTGWTSRDAAGQTIVSVGNISWNTAQLLTAIVQLIEADNDAPLIALASLQPVTLDASNAVIGSQFLQFAGVTSPVTILTSALTDEIGGGSGSDTITVTGNTFGGDKIYASPGNDQYSFLPGSSVDSWVDLVYEYLPGPITVTINGQNAPATVVKAGQGTDTLTNMQNALDWDGHGLGIWGTNGNDVFNVNGGAESWIVVNGGAGADTYTLTLAGDIRLRLANSWENAATAGNVINLATGQILNDGFGNAETLTIVDGAGRLEVETTILADNVIGSARRESFILRGGNDTLDGGGGFDRLRFDRADQTSGVVVDLAAGTATGSWRGEAFSKAISSIEFIRGSNHADTVRGSAVDERLEGRDGNDLLDGRAGNDTLEGQNGNDTLIGGAGNDSLNGGAGDDRIEVGSSTFGWGEAVIASGGNDTIVYTGVGASGGGWNDLVYANYSASIAVSISGPANIGSVTSAYGNDTLIDVARVLNDVNDGFSIFGTDLDGDSYDINGGAGSWMQIFGGRGIDSYILTMSGAIRLDFSGSWNEWRGATGALQINLASGQIANDGFGNAETLSINGGTERLEIHGTHHADTMTGSARGERFITGGGNDTIDGGGGIDLVRYNRNEMTSGVTVDLTAGTASGASSGVGFSQRLSGIEQIQGTHLADVIRGAAGDEWFIGNDGNDLLVGFAGNDTLEGGDGTDTLNGGIGDDFIYGGATTADLRDLVYGGDGHDSIDGGYGNDDLSGGNGNDTVLGDFGADTVVGNDGNDLIGGGAGGDLMFGNAGNDTLNGGFGYDRMNGGTGADSFFHAGVAGHASDWIQDFNAAEGDVLTVGLAGAVRSQFQINTTFTAGAGAAGVAEAFIIYRPTGQILWALVDGGDDAVINANIGGTIFDLTL